MLYLDYELYLGKYRASQEKLDELLSEREEMFGRTQPSATDYGKERLASSGGSGSPFDGYLIEKEQSRIDERIAEVKAIVKDRKKLLEMKERELRASMDTHDKIYRMRYIDRWSPYRIAGRVGYSVAQTYRILKIIDERVQHETK